MDDQIKQRAINNSKIYYNPGAAAAITINSLHRETLDVKTLISELRESTDRIYDNNFKEIESILLSQAQTLNVFFHQCLSRVANSDFLNHIQVMSDLAMKAQNNCRKTLLALDEIKNPKRATFIKQQNNAVNQQINNFENLTKLANEVINSEVAHESLDDRSKEQTITINPSLEAVGAINGGENT